MGGMANGCSAGWSGEGQLVGSEAVDDLATVRTGNEFLAGAFLSGIRVGAACESMRRTI